MTGKPRLNDQQLREMRSARLIELDPSEQCPHSRGRVQPRSACTLCRGVIVERLPAGQVAPTPPKQPGRKRTAP